MAPNCGRHSLRHGSWGPLRFILLSLIFFSFRLSIFCVYVELSKYIILDLPRVEFRLALDLHMICSALVDLLLNASNFQFSFPL